jgi:hypothetical protein
MIFGTIRRRLSLSCCNPRHFFFAASVFVTLYLATLYWVSSATARDPGSWFFDPHIAYRPQYADRRSFQAESFITAAESGPPFQRSAQPEEPPELCVGVPSIARDGVDYLRTTIGSLLEGLSREERDGIHLVVFIAHSNPEKHPATHQLWLNNLADEILRYNVSKEQFDHVVEMESDRAFSREKGLFDYTHLLKACHRTNASHVAMFEDDILAMDGWYHRTLSALRQAQVDRRRSDFLYLRLFYTEEFLGWNSEHWPTYLCWSTAVFVASGLVLLLIRSCIPRAKLFLTTETVLAICALPVPLLILLFFAAGKVSVLPLPTGVNIMNSYGCCSQGLVFPQHKVEALISWYEQAHVGFEDVLTEQYADKYEELRLAITPSVIQHVGRKSSKGDDFGKNAKHHLSVAEKLWNFGFELFDADVLHAEHEALGN